MGDAQNPEVLFSLTVNDREHIAAAVQRTACCSNMSTVNYLDVKAITNWSFQCLVNYCKTQDALIDKKANRML